MVPDLSNFYSLFRLNDYSLQPKYLGKILITQIRVDYYAFQNLIV